MIDTCTSHVEPGNTSGVRSIRLSRTGAAQYRNSYQSNTTGQEVRWSKMADRLVAAAVVTAVITEDDTADDEYDTICTAIMAHICQTTIRNQRTRIFGYVDKIVPRYNMQEFRRLFRLSSETFSTLTRHLTGCSEMLVHGEGGREPISVEKQLLLTLWYLSGNDNITKIADRFGVSESSVILSRTRVMDAVLNNLLSKFVTWPEDPADVVRKFSIRNGFPGIIGALDGTHVAIKAPKNNPQTYVNRKKFHSLQLQAVCNTEMLFTDCFCGFPGSCHDSRVLSRSPLWEQGLNKCNGNHIIADGGYPLRRWLLTPYRDNGHLTREQNHFNYVLSSNRVVIERAFALLKGRFRRLHFIDTQNLETAVKIIMTSCVLHNICLLNNEEVDDFIEMNETGTDAGQRQGLVLQENDREGIVKRNALARQLFV